MKHTLQQYDRVMALQPRFEELDGCIILRVPGSKTAAAPECNNKKARRWYVFDVKTRAHVCDLRKEEVPGWLVRRALAEEKDKTRGTEKTGKQYHVENIKQPKVVQQQFCFSGVV